MSNTPRERLGVVLDMPSGRAQGRAQAELRPSCARALARLGHPDEVGEDARSGDGGARAGALHDERLRCVPGEGQG